jgi:hypothetical protein
MKLMEWLWSKLPDTCEIDDCCRKGMRGNENRIYPFDGLPDFYIIMCDYCTSKYTRGELMMLDGISSRMIVRNGGKVADFTRKRRENAINKIRKG